MQAHAPGLAVHPAPPRARSRFFEFSDQAWLPRLFREFLTELLEHQLATYRIYEPVVPKLNELLRRSGSAEILDLCSGSGGPLPSLRGSLRAARITLSDRYPSHRAVGVRAPDVTYFPDVMDARAVPPRLRACRTLFTSFHHFDEEDARRILASAVEARAPIAVFEFTERSWVTPGLLLSAPWSVWRDTWRIRPRRWSRLFWTYVVPVMPLLYTWDAFVSHWRTYSPTQLRALTEEFTDFDWEIGTLPPDTPWITYLIGRPAG